MSDIIPSFVTTDMNEFNLKRVCVCVCALILNLKFCVLFYLSSLTVLTKKKKKSKKSFSGQSFFLKMRSTSSGRNGTVSLIRDWNVCRHILWMCKDTVVLRGVLLIKGYSPLPPNLALLTFTTHPPNHPFLFPLSPAVKSF